MKIKKVILGILGLLLLSAGITLGIYLVQNNQDIREKAAAETITYISPTTQEVGLGNSFSFAVKMDSGANAILGVDVALNFDSSAFEIVSLEKGSSISNLDSTITNTFDNSTGKIRYIVYTADKTKAVTGTGLEVLKVNAKAKSTADKKAYTIEFGSETAASGTSETQTVITTLNPGLVTLIDHVVATATPYVEGEPNSCGGTCGSNYNCKMNYFCYQGFCRNPKCPSDKTCGCAATTKPTTKATLKATKTPEVVYTETEKTLPEITTRPSFTLPPTSSPIADATKKTTDWVFIAILGAVGASLIFTIWAIIKAFKKPNTPVQHL